MLACIKRWFRQSDNTQGEQAVADTAAENPLQDDEAAYPDAGPVKKEAEERPDWLMMAAEQGNANAQFELALRFEEEGQGKRYGSAAHWFHEAAEQGHADAQFNLAQMYKLGRGVTKNERQAVYWTRRAAERNQSEAQYSLGVMHETGWGLLKDVEQAYAWYALAALNGLVDGRERRDRLAEQLDEEQLAKAQLRIEEAQAKISSTLRPTSPP